VSPQVVDLFCPAHGVDRGYPHLYTESIGPIQIGSDTLGSTWQIHLSATCTYGFEEATVLPEPDALFAGLVLIALLARCRRR
jgi:hypothetical protein